MIYEDVDPEAPVRQGDIFVRLPKAEFRLTSLAVVGDDGIYERSWSEIDLTDSQVAVALRSVTAIVISQDCDASRAQDISFCEIREFHEVERNAANQADQPKKWISLVTQQAKKNYKWYYLPIDSRPGLQARQAVDFRLTFSLALEDIQTLAARGSRVGRLNDVASSHFRERVAEFFRRYAFDEWYPFTRDEFAEYASRLEESPEAFPWQM